MTILILYILFFIATTLSLPSTPKLSDSRNWSFVYWLFAVLLIIVAGFRPGDVFADYDTYIDIYNSVINIEGINFIVIEPSFILISKVAYYLFDDITALFVVYAMIAIIIKFIAIKNISTLPFLTVLVYVSYYYIVHDMTQIRAGVASGILLLLLKYIYEKKKLIILIIIAISVLFHVSSLLMLPLVFIKTDKINKKLYLCLIPLTYILSVLHLDFLAILSKIPIPYIQQKLMSYNSEFSDVNIFNMLHLLSVFIAFIVLSKIDIVQKHNKYAYLAIKIYVISLSLYVFLSKIPVLAQRVSELYGIISIVVIPMLYYILKPKSVAKLTIIFISLFYFTRLITVIVQR